MRPPSFVSAVLALAVVVPAVSARAAPATPPNVVLITVDTLRADHRASAGIVAPTSPRGARRWPSVRATRRALRLSGHAW
jgi:hypothetical protein